MFIGVPRLNCHKSIRAFVPAFLLLNFCGKVRIPWLLLSIEKDEAKRLWCKDESAEEAVEAEKLGGLRSWTVFYAALEKRACSW